jgi:hypothetical protein
VSRVTSISGILGMIRLRLGTLTMDGLGWGMVRMLTGR